MKAEARTVICEECGKQARHLGFYAHWYGWHVTCLECGQQWSEEKKFPMVDACKNIRLAMNAWRGMKRQVRLEERGEPTVGWTQGPGPIFSFISEVEG